MYQGRALRQLCSAASRSTRIPCRTLHASARRLEKDNGDGKEGLSFRGQVYVSTAQRIQQERDREARFAAAHAARDRSSARQSLFLMFGMHTLCFTVTL